MSDKFELKPCPFCGGKAELIKGYNPPVHAVGVDPYIVKCSCCDAKIIGSVKFRAIKAWNQRTDDKFVLTLQHASDSKLIGKLMKELERKHGHWIVKHRHKGGFRMVKGVDAMGEVHEIQIDERYECNDLYCSECGGQAADNFLYYCLRCGAKMM